MGRNWAMHSGLAWMPCPNYHLRSVSHTISLWAGSTRIAPPTVSYYYCFISSTLHLVHRLHSISTDILEQRSPILTASTHIERIRQEMPATTTHIYFNSGTFGPLAACVVDAIKERLQR